MNKALGSILKTLKKKNILQITEQANCMLARTFPLSQSPLHYPDNSFNKGLSPDSSTLFLSVGIQDEWVQDCF
jgi:hypothetical protein